MPDRRLSFEGNKIADTGATALGKVLETHSELLPLRVRSLVAAHQACSDPAQHFRP